LTIIISGLKNEKGDIKIGLFNSEASWNSNKEKYRGGVLKIRTFDKARFSFKTDKMQIEIKIN
jgi:hypothetical protein